MPLIFDTVWITNRIEEGHNPLNDFEILTWSPCKTYTKKVKLTESIWQHSLIRGPWKDTFLPIWQKFNDAVVSRRQSLGILSRENSNFYQNAQLFIKDLNGFAKDSNSRARLEGTGHVYYIGEPYFKQDEVEAILGMKTTNGTVQLDLAQLAAKKSATYDSICAAHDLSPIYEMALNFKWDKASGKTESLWQTMSGLQLSEEKTNQNVPKGSGRGKKGKK
jgi:hypothetical protein